MPNTTSSMSSAGATSLNYSYSGKKHNDTQVESNKQTEEIPDFDTGAISLAIVRPASPRRQNGYANGTARHETDGDRCQPRGDSYQRWNAPPPSSLNHIRNASSGHPSSASSNAVHGAGNRQRGLSNAIRHMRAGSMSQNAHEIVDVLRAPVSYKLITLCVMWYWSSAMTSTSSKSILTSFDKPATLTLVQFALIAFYCILCSWLASTLPRLRVKVPALKFPIRKPDMEVIRTTLPLAVFQIVGHLLSSTATSKMSLSLVHTIKGLSPLFTVLAYRLVYDIRYPNATYLSLIPLTIGVMLACSGKQGSGGKGEFLGIVYSLLATIVFVTQNIFSKKLFNEAEESGGARALKLDKLNLLCYSSGLAFVLTGPIWLWSEGLDILGDFLWDGSVDLNLSPNSYDHGRLLLEFVFNGTFHFGQNILAFVLLSMVSPVTYSVASLIKRVFVIVVAIIWFRSPTTRLQAAGIGLTFTGLYLYDRSSEKNKADMRARTMTQSQADLPLLPLNTSATMLLTSQGAPVFENMTPMGQAPHLYTNG